MLDKLVSYFLSLQSFGLNLKKINHHSDILYIEYEHYPDSYVSFITDYLEDNGFKYEYDVSFNQRIVDINNLPQALINTYYVTNLKIHLSHIGLIRKNIKKHKL